ncbi:hypothetical protein PLICRDRAFT_172297 [Plicaturopsis crispa FD-325 SS-3]|nr:hypothetical protein PLICRDRAFT_172297 [Plicaturopsis crispa FD-325 SS-3]
MGVPGLWDIVNKAGQSRSFHHLCVVDGFESNKSGKRAYRVGIDASIWYQHAHFSTNEGENPKLRLLFFRACKLAELPLLPLFVFDGRERPKQKRGSKMGKAGSHGLTAELKNILDIFGMEWRMALGEAEAELAHLNRSGVIDAVMTDDIDALVFGALTVIRNPSLALTGNKCNPALDANGKASKHHVMVFTADNVRNHPEVSLTRGGMILFALLSGGDYDAGGVSKFGKETAHALARCGFGDQLLQAFQRRDQQPLDQFLPQWRDAINTELRTNSRGFLHRAHPSLSVPATFPDRTLLTNYASPVCSARGGGPMRGTGEMHLARIAAFAEEKFEWGHARALVHCFRTLVWGPAVMRVLRRAALEADDRERDRRIAAGILDAAIRGPLTPSNAEAVGTPAGLVKKFLDMSDVERRRATFANHGSQPSAAAAPDPNPLILRIVGTRQHVSTDRVLEYRVEVSPIQLVAMAKAGIKGTRVDPGTTKELKTPPPEPNSPMLMWIPVSMMRQVHPRLVEEYEFGAGAKKQKASRGKGKAKATSGDEESASGMESSPVRAPPKPRKRAANAASSSSASAGPSRAIPDGALAGPSRAQPSASGFLFTFPNPDDPSMLAMSDNEDAPTQERGGRIDVLYNEIMGATGLSQQSQRPQRPAASDAEDDPPQQRDAMDRIFDQIMGPEPGASRSRKKAPARKRPRLSAPDVPSRNARAKGTAKSNASKRRKTTHGPAPDVPRMVDLDETDDDADAESDHAPPDRFDIMFDQIMGIGGRKPVAAAARKKPPAPATANVHRSTVLSNLRGSQAVPKRRPVVVSSSISSLGREPAPPRPQPPPVIGLDSDVIEIFSDVEDAPPPRASSSSNRPRPSLHAARGGAGMHEYPMSSSSQDSSLFLDDADIFIDLT